MLSDLLADKPLRFPHSQALPRRPRPCPQHELRRSGLGARAFRDICRAPCLRLRSFRPRPRHAWLPARRLRSRRPRRLACRPRFRPAGGRAVRPTYPADPCFRSSSLLCPAGQPPVLSVLYRRSPRSDRLCIPSAGSLRDTVLQELHATPLGGHFGRNKTLALARRSVWWPGLSVAVGEYVRACPTCQRVKADHLSPAGLLSFPPPFLPIGVAAASASTSSNCRWRVRPRLLAGATRSPARSRLACPHLQDRHRRDRGATL